MAKIVLGIGTSHSPMNVLKAEDWEARVIEEMKPTNRALFTLDGQRTTYDELKAQRGEPYKHLCTLEQFQRWAAEAQTQLDRLADELENAAPDVVIVIGDDQRELFGAENTPAFAIYYGDEIVMHPTDLSKRPAWQKPLWGGYGMDAAHRHPGAPALAKDLIERMMDLGVDVSAADSVPNAELRGFGHAFGFISKRLYRGRSIPMLPVLLNTYSPPNVPSSARSYEIGQKLRIAIEQCPQNLRVAIIASGGLSHFICEEDHDLKVMRALESRDRQFLCSIPRGALVSGSSEILNWITAGGALEGMKVSWSHYIALRRSPAGTGIGLGFMVWQ